MSSVRAALSVAAFVVLLAGGAVACGSDPAAPPAAPARVAARAAVPDSLAAGTLLAPAPAVLVTDAGGRPVSGVAVTFTVVAGDGTLSGAAARTDASGVAAPGGWTIGPGVGRNALTATVAGLAPVTFTVVGVPGAPAVLAALSADTLRGEPLDTLGVLAVRVTDRFGNPVARARVTWALPAGAGTLSADTTTTDAAGVAATRWVAGGEGVFAARASLVAAPAAVAALPARVEGVVARVEVAPADLDLVVGAEGAVAVTAFDRRGVPLLGRPVTWSVSRAAVARVGVDGRVSADEVGRVTVVAAVARPAGAPATATARLLVRPRLVDSLAIPAGSGHVEVYGVNDARTVVGAAYSWSGCNCARPFAHSPGAGARLLPLLAGGNGGQARAVNGAGTVAGSSTAADGKTHVVTWSAAQSVSDLGLLGAYTSAGVAITSAGHILVARDTLLRGGLVRRGAVRAPDGTLRDLGSLDDGGSEPVAISEGGTVVGSSSAGFTWGAVWWRAGGGPQRLDAVTGFPLGVATQADGTELVVGERAAGVRPGTIIGITRAFVWSAADGLLDLGTLGGESSTARAVNGRGQVVGWANTPDGKRHAFLWTRETGMLDLGLAAGSTWSDARAVSAGGVIAGTVPVSDAANAFPRIGFDERPVVWVTRRGQ